MTPLVIAFGLAMASQQALASTGSISFFGEVYSGTCAIEVIDPSTGRPASRIHMGNVNAAQFKQADDEAANRALCSGARWCHGPGLDHQGQRRHTRTQRDNHQAVPPT